MAAGRAGGGGESRQSGDLGPGQGGKSSCYFKQGGEGADEDSLLDQAQLPELCFNQASGFGLPCCSLHCPILVKIIAKSVYPETTILEL